VHSSAARIGQKFLTNYWNDGMVSILEIGSKDVNGSLRAAAPPSAIYTGVDIEPGPGVDILVAAGSAIPFPDESFDLVLASSVFEHDIFWWKTLEEMFRVCKSSGFVYVSAPSNGPVHRHPLDLFRFYPDASLSMVEIGRKSSAPSAVLVESFVAEQDPVGIWNDFVCVLSKEPLASDSPQLIHLTEKCTNVWEKNRFLESTHTEIPEDGRQSEALRLSQNLNSQLERALSDVYSSVSWRVTWPLRRLRKSFRDIFSR
jgi:SAM-dependent methyltransferase